MRKKNLSGLVFYLYLQKLLRLACVEENEGKDVSTRMLIEAGNESCHDKTVEAAV